MRTKKIELYTYSELSEEAKEKARDWYRQGALEHEWWDCIFDDAKTIGALMGIEIDQIYFSGFSSQGDGACFTGEYQYKKGSVTKIKEYAPQDNELHRIVENLRDIQRQNFYALSATIQHEGRYSHEYSVRVNVSDSRQEYWQDISSDTAESLSDALRDFMRWIYNVLESECDWLVSDKQIVESIEINDYEFTADGEIA